MNYFQFPWRFLSLEILVASFLAGYVVYLLARTKLNKFKFFTTSLFILLAFSLGTGYAKPAHYLYRDDNYYISRSNFIDGTNSPGNAFNTKYFKGISYKSGEKIAFIEGEGEVNTKEVKAETYLFNVTADSESKVQINTAYFPGWSVFVNGVKAKTDVTDDGLFSFLLPEGRHEVKVIFANTPIRTFAVICSLVSGLAVLALFIRALFATIKRHEHSN